MSGPALPPDVIEIRGIRGFGRHGVFDHERADGQEFSVDVRLELDTRTAAASDRLADTVDYGAVAEQVHAAIENDPVDLIETLAQRIADICLAVGLRSVGSFTTSFGRAYGLSPMAYRAAYPPAASRVSIPTCMLQAYARPNSSTFGEDSGKRSG